MKTQLFAFLTLGFLPFFINVQNHPNEMEKMEDSITAFKEKDSKLTRLIEFTISEIEEHDRDRSVILYSKARFSGKSFELNNDWSASNLHNHWNDEIASIEVPRGLEVWLYEHKNFRGKSLCISGDWSVRDKPWWRNRISSVRLVYTSDREWSKRHKRHRHKDHHWRDGHKKKGVILYEDRHFSGRSITIYGDWLGKHKDDFWDDRISSIYVPSGYKVILYKKSGFRGDSKTLKGPRSVQLEKGSWNDKVSSIEIVRRK